MYQECPQGVAVIECQGVLQCSRNVLKCPQVPAYLTCKKKNPSFWGTSFLSAQIILAHVVRAPSVMQLGFFVNRKHQIMNATFKVYKL